MAKNGEIDHLKAALDIYLDNIYETAENQFEYSMWYSWGMGAYVLLRGFKEIQGFEMTPCSLNKAKLFFEVGLQAMISFWYNIQESKKKYTDEQKKESRSNSLANIQTFLGFNSEDSIKLYLGFDSELQSCLNTQKMPLPYVYIFFQRCRECLIGEQILDWSQLQLPTGPNFFMKAYQAVYKDKGQYYKDPVEDPIIKVKAWTAMISANNSMVDVFNKMIVLGRQG